jgi:hypothetical protein
MLTKCSNVMFVEKTVELRRSRRYQLQARASFSWERPDGLLQEGKGAIRDISDRGVFIVADVALSPGVRLDVDVHLRSPEVSGGSLQLHGEGIVVRVDRGAGGAKGFAATVAFRTEAAGGPPVVNPKRLQ